MPYLDFEALGRTPLKTEPYDYLVVADFVRADQFRSVVADYPQVPGPGSHPLSELTIGGHFKGLLDELNGPELRPVHSPGPRDYHPSPRATAHPRQSVRLSASAASSGA